MSTKLNVLDEVIDKHGKYPKRYTVIAEPSDHVVQVQDRRGRVLYKFLKDLELPPCQG